MSRATQIKMVKRLAMPEVGHWHFEFIFKPHYARHGAMHLSFGFFKLLALPPQGEMVQPYHYKGFWLRWDWRLPEWGIARTWNTWEETKAKLQKVNETQGVEPYCARFSQHFSPTNRFNCHYCGACERCGKVGHKYKDCTLEI